jgi:hypothetical protein
MERHQDGSKGTDQQVKFSSENSRIYWNLNPEVLVMKNPYQRVNLALLCIRGSKVNEWVDEQLRALDAKTIG